MTTFDLIRLANELFKLKGAYPNYTGLMIPPADSSICRYRQPALSIEIKVNKFDGGKCQFFACIRSIDDSGCSIFGPTEDEERAKGRFMKFLELIRGLEYQCPTKAELEEACKKIGVYPDYW